MPLRAAMIAPPLVEVDHPIQPPPDHPITFDQVAAGLRDGKYHSIVCLVGAGISVAAGIPDFRSPGTGLYHNLKRFNLPHPTDIFNLPYYRDHPEPFNTLAQEMWPGQYQPTTCHQYLHSLHTKGFLRRIYTQNIDGLERTVGIPLDSLVEAHGSFFGATCLSCKDSQSIEEVKKVVMGGGVPRCRCGGLVKPDVVMFGEETTLESPVVRKQLVEDFSACDLLFIMGTSLKVQPFASLVALVGDEVPRVLINQEKVGESIEHLRQVQGEYVVVEDGLKFDGPTRDVALLGDCQESIRRLKEAEGGVD